MYCLTKVLSIKETRLLLDGHPATPAHGIPDPKHPFHCQVFDYLREHKT